MMSASKLSEEMLTLFRVNMKALDPKAEPTEFQQILTEAIAEGLIDVLSKSGTVGATPAPVAIGNGFGLIVQPDIMQKAAIAKMMLQTKNKGMALDLILQAVMVPTAKHLAEAVEVVPQSGFGGQGLPPQIEDSSLSASIISKLPTETRNKITQSKHGADLIKAIAFGFAAGLKVSVPGLVPFGSVPPPPGLLLAVFK